MDEERLSITNNDSLHCDRTPENQNWKIDTSDVNFDGSAGTQVDWCVL